jgi:hypothetical protein
MAMGSALAPEDTLLAFDLLKKALIDTSSVIYIQKAGYFDILGRTIQLYSIPEVLSEIKTGAPGVRVMRSSGSASLSTDQKLVCCALDNKMAMISEDKRILTALQCAEAPYYNALMMLNLLLYSQKIDDEGYRHYYLALKKIARYSAAVWEFGRYIYSTVKFSQGNINLWTSPPK